MSKLNKISLDGTTYDIGGGSTYAGATTSSSPFVLEDHEPGIYTFDDAMPYIKRLNADTGYWQNPLEDCRINLIVKPTSETVDGTILFTYWNGEHGTINKIGSSDTSASGYGGLASYGSVSSTRKTLYAEGSQTITGTKTFSALPQSSVVPTSDNQLANKKYVDDSIPDTSDFIPYYDSGYYMTPTSWTVVSELPDYQVSGRIYFVAPDYVEQYVNTSVIPNGFNSGVTWSYITNKLVSTTDHTDVKQSWQNTANNTTSKYTSVQIHAPKYDVHVAAVPSFTNSYSEDLYMYGVLEQRNPQTTALIYSAYLDVDSNLTSDTTYYYDRDDYDYDGTPVPIYVPGSTSFHYTIGTNGGLACLKGDTPIKISNTKTKQLKNLEVGDTVIDAGGNKTKVIKTLKHTIPMTFNITLSNEDTLVASPGHKFSIHGRYRRACQVLKDHKLDRFDGSTFDVIGTETKEEEMEVYEILTESGTYTLGNGIICECEAI